MTAFFATIGALAVGAFCLLVVAGTVSGYLISRRERRRTKALESCYRQYETARSQWYAARARMRRRRA